MPILASNLAGVEVIRGSVLSVRVDQQPPAVQPAVAVVSGPWDEHRLLTTDEANRYLGRKKGFLEKRRSSGIDSPPYIQARPRGAVRYRFADLVAWEDSKLRDNSSYN
jgi:hypothetical protein